MATASFRVDTSGLRRKIQAAREITPQMRDNALTAVMAQGAEFIVERWPADTNRSKRAWIMAAAQAGLFSAPLPPLRRSRYAEFIRSRLERRLAQSEKRLRWLEGVAEKRKAEIAARKQKRRGRPPKRDLPERWPSYRKEMKVRDRAAEALEEWDAQQGEASIIWGRHNARGLRSVHRVLPKVYGGQGVKTGAPGRLSIVLINKEPHARIVEKNTRVVAAAKAAVRRAGARTIKASMARDLVSRAGWTVNPSLKGAA